MASMIHTTLGHVGWLDNVFVHAGSAATTTPAVFGSTMIKITGRNQTNRTADLLTKTNDTANAAKAVPWHLQKSY